MKHILNLAIPLTGLFLLFTLSLQGANDVIFQHKDSVLFKKHIQFVKQEHKKLGKTLHRLIKKTSSDSISHNQYILIAERYNQAIEEFDYLHQPSRKRIGRSYRQSVTHKGLIEKTQRELKSVSRKNTRRLISIGKLKQVKSIQKETVYASARSKYAGKVQYKDVLDKLHQKRVTDLISKQHFISDIRNGKQTFSNALQKYRGVPAIKLPTNLQTNRDVNKVFTLKPLAMQQRKPSFQQKFNNSLSNPLTQILDSTQGGDTLVFFKFNPYKAMPALHRIKFGGNSQVDRITTGGTLLTYAVNLNYLLTPEVKPVLGIGFSHSLKQKGRSLEASGVNYTIRFGAEAKVYKMIAAFSSYEFEMKASERSPVSKDRSDLVIGVTNHSGAKRTLKIWAGVRIGALITGRADAFVFRMGL